MSFLIVYDLLRPGQNYDRLWTELQRFGAVRVLESTWYLRSNYNCIQLRDHFRQFIDANDRLLVVRFDDWAGRSVLERLD